MEGPENVYKTVVVKRERDSLEHFGPDKNETLK
jgi:hypothetical protein